MFKRKLLVNALILAGLSGGFYSTAWAAAPIPGAEGEVGVGETDCAAAGNSLVIADGATALMKGTVGGILTPAEVGPPAVLAVMDDVDFYKVTGGVPGDLVKVTVVRRGTSTVVPAFSGRDSITCADLGSSNGNYEIPANGEFIVQLDTPGSLANYTVTVSPVDVIGDVSGKVIDAVTKKPINYKYNPMVDLYACNAAGTSCAPDAVAHDYLYVDGKFNLSSAGLAVGNYKVVARASQYQDEESAIVAIDADGTNVGTIALQPNPVTISVAGCNKVGGSLPSTGGTCKLKVTLTNNSGAALKSSLWGVVEGNGIDAMGQITEFGLATKAVALAKGASMIYDYSVVVPNEVSDSANIGVHFYVGAGNFNVIARDDSFALYKFGEDDPFAVVPESQQPGHNPGNFWNLFLTGPKK